MAHFAEVDHTGRVLRVIVIANDDLLDQNGDEQENLGISVCQQIFGSTMRWVQTSYNSNFRKKFASIGDIYDDEHDVFYDPRQPFPSWSLDENFNWQPPVEHPGHGFYNWDEQGQVWVSAEIGDN